MRVSLSGGNDERDWEGGLQKGVGLLFRGYRQFKGKLLKQNRILSCHLSHNVNIGIC